MMSEYAVHTGWMWVPALAGVLVLFLLMRGMKSKH
jgi:hypothetical protein